MSLYNFTLKGNLPALKNGKVIITRPYPRLIANKTVQKWNKSAAKQMKELGLCDEMIDFPIELIINVYKGTAHKYDADNCAGTVMDLLTHVQFYEDDSLVQRLVVNKKQIDKQNPRVEIQINEIQTS